MWIRILTRFADWALHLSFQIFVHLNPFINLFDESLHTPSYIRARCPLLFTTLLMVGAKFWRPQAFRSVQRMAEDLSVRAWREGWKSVEVVQAFMCLTYWKEPDDSVSQKTVVACFSLCVHWF